MNVLNVTTLFKRRPPESTEGMTAAERLEVGRRKLVELQLQLSDFERQRDGAESGLAELRGRSVVDQAAEQLVAGEEVRIGDLERQRTEATLAVRIAKRAVELQREQLGKLQSAAAVELVDARLPEYTTAVRALAEALVAAAKASEREREIREAMLDTNLPVCGPLIPVPFRGFGVLREDASRLSQFFREAAEAGYLTIAEVKKLVPADWHDKWAWFWCLQNPPKKTKDVSKPKLVEGWVGR